MADDPGKAGAQGVAGHAAAGARLHLGRVRSEEGTGDPGADPRDGGRRSGGDRAGLTSGSDSTSGGAQAAGWTVWPTVHSRRGPRFDPAHSMVDPNDSASWAVPYTDLTMLLMVFFIVVLAIVGPDPTRTNAQSDASASGLQDSTQPPQDAHSVAPPSLAQTLLDGGDGVLSGHGSLAEHRPSTQQGITGEGAPPLALGGAEAARGDAQTDRAAAQSSPRETAEAMDALQRDAAFAQEWARRVQVLEDAAEAFLQARDLADLIVLHRTTRGIELRLPDDLLFQSGDAEIRVTGTQVLAQVAPLLQSLGGDIQVSGHTDTVPIQTARFPPNWELSAARAIEVVRLLRDYGIPETRMQAVGHGANRPIASNAHAAGRAVNRRVTIDVTPTPVDPTTLR